jgi:hypothetical protein
VSKNGPKKGKLSARERRALLARVQAWRSGMAAMRRQALGGQNLSP